MTGRIFKGVGGLYIVQHENDLYECKAKGIFRSRGITPLVGDYVEIYVIDEEQKTGRIDEIIERKNSIYRPLAANVDQALVFFAAIDPEPNLNLLDRFLITMSQQSVETVICFNKTDKVDEKQIDALRKTYEKSGYRILFTSVLEEEGIDTIKSVLQGKTTILAGPSGVGKSTLTNSIQNIVFMQTGVLSEKIKRGKHTTRHSELIYIEKDTYIIDTPGFTSLYLKDIEKEELKFFFEEFEQYSEKCRYKGCLHIGETDCGVKQALDEGLISRSRYDNYRLLYEELKNTKKY